jgi:putative zinc finger/helix-turn-helix YgiT family protein
MAKVTCPACGKAKMESKLIPHLKTEFEGVSIEVKDAHLSECPACGERTYSGNELARWKKIKQTALADRNLLPAGADVKRLREAREMSVAQLASLLGVTRQTVHSWERAEDEYVKSGPAAILLVMLLEEIAVNADDVFRTIVRVAERCGKPAIGKTPHTDAGNSVWTRPFKRSPIAKETPAGSPKFYKPAA